MTPASPVVDSRADRTAQGVIAVILLAAFVFRQIWVLPALGVLIGAGAVFGPPGNPFLALFARFVSPQLSAPKTHEHAATLRLQDALGVALLGVATVCMLIGLGGLAWIVALVAAGVAVIAATTGVHLGVTVRDRIRRR